MKKSLLLISALIAGNLAISQVVFQSDMSSWDTSTPTKLTDWMGTKTSISASNVNKITTGATYGTAMASLVNTGSGHKRFTTQAVTVVGGKDYIITVWAAATGGHLRGSFYDLTNSAYTSYTSYDTINSTTLTMYTFTVSAPATCTSAEFMLSLRKTDAATSTSGVGITIDSVCVTQVAPPAPAQKSIYEIQYTTASSGDSPYKDSIVETAGIVTGIASRGYWIQDSSAAWHGVYVYDNVNTPAIGDDVTIIGKVKEYYGLTEMVNLTSFTNNSSGNTVPMPIQLTGATFPMEANEGVLVEIKNSICVLDSAGHGEWLIQTGSDTTVVDDLIFAYIPDSGSTYNVTGLVTYSYGEFKLEPRDSSDINKHIASINEVNKVDFSVYPNPANNELNIVMNEKITSIAIYSMDGQLVLTSDTKQMNVSKLNSGVYLIKIISDNKVGVKRFVKQ